MLRLISAAMLSLAVTVSAGAFELIQMSGSTTVSPVAKKLEEAYRKSHDETMFHVREVGCYRGVRDIGHQRVSIGLLARELKENEREKFPDLTRKVIGYDAVAVIVNKENPVDRLSIEQFRRILLGKDDKWKDFGGKNRPIHIVSEDFGRSGFEAILSYLDLSASMTNVHGENFIVYKRHSQLFSKNPAMIVRSNQEMITAVADDPDAIGYSSSVEVETAMQAGKPLKIVRLDGRYPSNRYIEDGSYPMRRELSLVVHEPMEPVVRSFVEFAQSEKGQEIVRSMGYPTRVKK